MMEKELAKIAPPENIAVWVENLVQERIVTNWESQDAPPHLTTIRDRVLSVEEKLRGRMLGCYQQVLADGELEDDRSEERSKLRLTGLVVRRDGRLVSYNPIYGAVFNNVWVEGQLADLRPEFYGSAFREWQGAEQKDGFLLRGEALKNADEWARGKRLSDADEEFLRESREVERVESNLKFEAEQQAREIAEEKAIILGEAKLQADRRVLVGSGVLAVTLLLAAVAGGWATRFVNDANVKVADTRKDALAKSQKADEDVRSAKTEAEAIGKKADEIKKLAAKADAESKQNIKEALAKKEEADRNVEEAQKNLELAKAEAENVSQESAEKVTAAQAKIADAEIKVKEAINAQKEASAKFKDVSITLQKKESKLNQTEKNLLDTWTISQSEVLRQQGKNEDAVKILSQVIKVNPLNNFALLSRGNIFFQNKNYGESISDYKKALSIDDKYPITHFLIGYYFFSQKEYDEAIRSFEKAISLDPKYGYAYLYLGNALCGKEQYKAAVLAFRKAIEVSPDSICLVCALISLGNALVNQNKLDEAIDVYRQTINIEPKNAAAYNYLGNALFKKNEINQSILAIRKAIELDPKLANAYFSLGNLLISQSSFTEAATAYQQAISIDPTIPDIYNYLGVALGKQNKFDEAIDAIQKAIKIEPKNAVTYDNLGYILASQNEYNEAIIAFKQSIALNPKYIKAYKNLGRILIIQNKLDEADMIIHKAIEISPKDAELYNDLGTLLRMKNKFDESIFYFQQAIKIDPSLAIFHNNLCWIGILTGKKSRDFLSSCDKGVELTSGKENFDSRYIRGIARAIHGDINRSIEDFQFCLKWLEESDLKDSATARVITEQWIEELRAGKQPSEIFTQKVLAQMRND
jgi:tetratricopeptide (TPR) repeat protein